MRLNVAVLIGSGSLLFATPASAQLVYGAWNNTGKCRLATVQGRGRFAQPYAPGSEAPQECIWEREVKDCPRLRDKARHPFQCATHREKSGYTTIPPYN